jgi:hypothetical protein
MRIWSNKAPRAAYVEVLLCSAHLFDKRKMRKGIGWSVSANVFSRDSRFDGLVDFTFNSFDKNEAEKKVKEIAKQYGLSEDIGLKHRQAVWAV